MDFGTVGHASPILVSGVYRSGTTFLAALLNNFPNIQAASSTVKFLRFCLQRYGSMEQRENFHLLLDETAQRVKSRWKIELDQKTILESWGRCNNKTYARAYDIILSSVLLSGTQSTRWAEKIAVQWRDIPVFLKMFPAGQVLHIIRDPRDVTASYKKMTYEPWPAHMDTALNCIASMNEIKELQAEFGAGRIHIVRAEDLAQDLEGQMRAMCTFLGEPYTPELIDLDNSAEIQGEAWRTNTSFEDDGQNFQHARNRWKETLSSAEVFLCELICQPQLAQFGYEGGGQELSSVDFSEIQKMVLDPWFGDRLSNYLKTGKGSQGYRSDPYDTEMKIVFGENYKLRSQQKKAPSAALI